MADERMMQHFPRTRESRWQSACSYLINRSSRSHYRELRSVLLSSLSRSASSESFRIIPRKISA